VESGATHDPRWPTLLFAAGVRPWHQNAPVVAEAGKPIPAWWSTTTQEIAPGAILGVYRA
jgi:hypothetical protein